MLKNKGDKFKDKQIEKNDFKDSRRTYPGLSNEDKAQIKQAVEGLKELKKELDENPEAKATFEYIQSLFGVNIAQSESNESKESVDKIRTAAVAGKASSVINPHGSKSLFEGTGYQNVKVEVNQDSIDNMKDNSIYFSNKAENPFEKTPYDFESISTLIDYLYSLDGAGFECDYQYIPYRENKRIGTSAKFITSRKTTNAPQRSGILSQMNQPKEESNTEKEDETQVITEVIRYGKIEELDENPTTVKQFLNPANPLLANNAVRDWFKKYFDIKEEDENRICFLNEVLK